MIKLVQGFDIRQPLPIDGRILLSEDEMKNVDTNLMPDKYFAINKDDGRLYLFDKNNSTSTTTGGFRPADDVVKAYADEKAAEISSHLDDYVKNEDLAEELTPYAKLVDAANKIDFRMDPGFILKFVLQNNAGEELDTAEVDLPLEQLVVDAEYDEERNVIILYVQSETSEIKDIEIPLGNLVSSLVSKVEFLDHADNLDLHVSDDERLKWNNAAEKADDAVKPEDMHTHINAGENVHIDIDSNGDMTINADDTVYEAGRGINIIDGVISSTQANPKWTDIEDDSTVGPMDNEALANLFNAKQDKIGDGTTIPVSAITGLSDVAISGDYDDLTGAPTKVSDLENDAGYVTVTDIPEIPDASTTSKGIVQLNDATNSSSSTLAATSKAVKAAMDEALNAEGIANNARGNADSANSAARTAQTKADQAYTLANNAYNYAGTANAAAQSAQQTADQAYSLAGSAVKTESDPIFAASAAARITSQDISKWNAKSDFSGSYEDLTDKPTIPTVPTNVSAFTNDSGYLTSYTEEDPTVPAWAKKSTKPSYTYSEISDKPTLAAVATSGSYNDLTNKPIIPAAQVNSDWNASSGVARILNKPTIPTVPTNVSAFNNDAGYLTSFTETDPTVPTWAKATNKPTYTATEVGAVASITVNGSSKTPTSGVVDLGTIVNAGDGIKVTTNNTVGINSKIKLAVIGSNAGGTWTSLGQGDPSSPDEAHKGKFGYSTTINDSAIKGGGHPIIDLDTSTYVSASQYQEYLADYNKIYRAVTSNGSITLYAVAIPTNSFFINIVGC